MKRPHKRAEISPVTILESELTALRQDLRATIHAYAARLEVDLAETIAALSTAKHAKSLSRERLRQIRELTIKVRKRSIKPERGRRKDLRKIDALIRNLYSTTHPNAPRGAPR
jgi:hypothetical protein